MSYPNDVISCLRLTEAAITAQYEENSNYWREERQYANRNALTVSEQIANMEATLQQVNDRMHATESSGIRNTLSILSDELHFSIRKKKCALTALVDRAHEAARKSALVETTAEHHKMLLMMLTMQPDFEDPYKNYYYTLDYGILSPEVKNMLDDILSKKDTDVSTAQIRDDRDSTGHGSSTNHSTNHRRAYDRSDNRNHSDSRGHNDITKRKKDLIDRIDDSDRERRRKY